MATATAADPASRPRRNGRGRIAVRIAIVATAAAACAMAAGPNLGAMAVKSRDPVLLRQAAAFSPGAAAYAAEAEFAAGRSGPAMELARSSLRQTPLSARALRTLGLAAQETGDGELAATAMALAGAVGWRDTPTQLWLIDAFTRQGDYASALAGVDALLRRRQSQDEMFAVAMAAALEPAARSVLIERLSQRPEWRHGFFLRAGKLPPDQFGAFQDFLADMKASGAAPQPAELAGFVSALYDKGGHRQAAQVWRLHGDRAGSAPGNLFFDGDFAAATTESRPRSPFEWYFPQVAGMEIALGAPPGRPGERALHASSVGNARFLAAKQSLALGPGRYTLSMDATTEPGLKLEGFSWIVECHSAPPPSVTERRARLPDDWTRIDYAFSIDAACSSQRISFLLHGGQSQPLSLWVDRLRLRRLAHS